MAKPRGVLVLLGSVLTLSPPLASVSGVSLTTTYGLFIFFVTEAEDELLGLGVTDGLGVGEIAGVLAEGVARSVSEVLG